MKTLILNKFEIIPSGSKHATHTVYSNRKPTPSLLNYSDFCKGMCTEIDRGERYSSCSRYTYETHLVSNDKGIYLGPIAAVQMSIKEHYGEIEYVIIRKQ